MCDWISFVFSMGIFIMKTKQCNNCGEFKQLSEFCKSKKHKYGVFYYCKLCQKIKFKEYSHTKEGLITLPKDMGRKLYNILK